FKNNLNNFLRVSVVKEYDFEIVVEYLLKVCTCPDLLKNNLLSRTFSPLSESKGCCRVFYKLNGVFQGVLKCYLLEINVSKKKKGAFFFAFLMGAVFTGYRFSSVQKTNK
ncbi:hypothetical protein BpHYR1_033776, partial [Brachionus plicatilis]